MGDVVTALQMVATLDVLAFILLGTAVGAAAAIIPGITGATVMAMALGATATIDPILALAVLAGMYAASGFAGSISAILINVPGEAMNAPTCLDGFPLARQGRAAYALGASAAASALGALVGVAFLIATFPVQRTIVLSFGPPEVFALVVLAMVLISIVGDESVLKGLVSGLLGMAAGLVGLSVVVGIERYTFGVLELRSGIPLVPAVIGLFSVPEIVALLRENRTIANVAVPDPKGAWAGVLEVLRRPRMLLQGGMIGSLTGMVPGVGGTVATWLSYYFAKATSPRKERYGGGEVEGVIASESALDATAGGSLVPVFTIGLPGSIATVFILASFQLHGIIPGPALYRQNAHIIWVVIVALVIANVAISVIGLMAVRLLARLTFISVTLIAPFIFAAAWTGAMATTRYYGLLVALSAGLLGVALARFDYPRAPFVIGLILLPLAETNFLRAMQIARGGLDFLGRPITLAVLVLTVVLLGSVFLGRIVLARRAAQQAPTMAVESPRTDVRELGLVVPLAVLAGTLLFESVTGAIRGAELRPHIFPLLVLLALGGCLGVRLAGLVRAWVSGHLALVVREDVYSTAYVIGWVLLSAGLALMLGPAVGSGVYIWLFLMAFRTGTALGPRAVRSGVAGVIAGLAIHLLFEWALGVVLPSGLLV